MTALKHPFPGPIWSSKGDATLGATTVMTQCTSTQVCDFLYLSPGPTWSSGDYVIVGSSTASVAGEVIFAGSPPVPIPVQNLGQLAIKGSGALTLFASFYN